jgi:glycosyltransferase involved in cell wall biosynthesis
MKICIIAFGITHYYYPDGSPGYGGSEVQAAFLAEALTSIGQDVTLVVADLDADKALPHRAVNAFHADRGVRVLRFFHPRLSGMLRALESADADIYYQRNTSGATGIAAIFCRKQSRVFVYGAGSDTDFSFTKSRLDNLRDRFLYYMGIKMADGIVVQNRYQEKLCLEKLGKPAKMISNGVKIVDSLSSSPRDLVVWVGAIRRVKGPELFLELARRLPDTRFVMIGGDTPTEKSFAERVVESSRRLDNLTLTGRLSTSDVAEYLKRAALLVNTSEVEGFPNAYLEAWNYGVPVVSLSDVDGLIEQEGLGVVCKDIDEMEHVLASLTTDRGKLKVMAGNARLLVRERFSSEALAREDVTFFENLRRERRGARK